MGLVPEAEYVALCPVEVRVAGDDIFVAVHCRGYGRALGRVLLGDDRLLAFVDELRVVEFVPSEPQAGCYYLTITEAELHVFHRCFVV